MSEFDTNNSSRGDFKILNSGASDHYAVLFKGEPATRERVGFRMNTIQQRTILRIYQRYVNDSTSQIALQDLIDDIKTAVNPYRVIGDASSTIQSATITEEREMMMEPANAPAWLYVELVGVCDEEEIISYAE